MNGNVSNDGLLLYSCVYAIYLLDDVVKDALPNVAHGG